MFGKGKKDKDGEDAALAALAAEEAGLLISTGPQWDGAQQEQQAPADASVAGAELADPGEPSAEAQPDPGAEPAAAEPAADEPAAAEPAADDPLALFRAVVADTSAGDLTKEIDDVPMEALMEELREIRSMLPATAPEEA